MREKEYFTVRNLNNGGIYRIGKRKLDKEIGEWELIDGTDGAALPEVSQESEVSVLKKIEEFMNTDVDLGDLEESEPEIMESVDLESLSYPALKDLCKAKGIEVKGNPKKENLIAMYNEEI
jgi:hypothetical protein